MADTTTTIDPQTTDSPSSAMKNWMSRITEDMTEGTDNGTTDGHTGTAAPVAGTSTTSTVGTTDATVPATATTTTGQDQKQDFRWPRSAQEWKKFNETHKKIEDDLRAESAAAKKRAEEFEAKAKEIEAKFASQPKPEPAPDFTAEIERLKKEREDYAERLRLVDVREDPQFKSYYGKKTETAINLAKQIVGSEKGETVANLLRQPESQWKEEALANILIDLSPLQQSRLGGVLNNLAELDAEQQSEVSRYKELANQRETAAKTKQAEIKSNLEKLFTQIVEARSGKDGMAVFQRRDNDAGYNSAVEKRIAAAKSLLFDQGSIKPEEIMNAALDAVALRPVLEHNLALQKELTTLTEQINALKASTPKVDITSGSAAGQTTSTKPEFKNPHDAGKWFAQRMAEGLNQG